MAPDDGAHAHRARFARGIERAAAQGRGAVIGQALPDRVHLAVGGRVAVRPPEIAPARNDRALAHDDGAERKVRLPRLLDRHAHEPDVLGGRRTAALRMRDRGENGRTREAGHESPPAWKNMSASTVASIVHVTTSYSAARSGSNRIALSIDGTITLGSLGRQTLTMPKHSGLAA